MDTADTRQYAPSRFEWIHSTRLHLILTAFLAVAMPFLMLRAYLQDTIGRASTATFEVGGVAVPWVLAIAAVIGLVGLALARPYINRGRIVAAAIIFLMITYAQYINDFYFGHRFYELQMNWHYFAYMIFAIMVYRDLSPRGYSPAQVIGFAYFSALCFSTFDEGFQFFINNRVFDPGDISKDAWGSLMGILLVYSGSGQVKSWLPIRHRHIRDYFGHPGSLIVLLGVLGFTLLTYASMLNFTGELLALVFLTAVTFAVVFGLIHVSQFRAVGWAMLVIGVLAVGVQAWAAYTYSDSGITYWRPGLAVYRGFLWPYFDFAILPDGTFHPATKQHGFNPRDRNFFLMQQADIILIGSGPMGEGGLGFYDARPHFMFNQYLKHGSQVLILPTGKACETFNRLKKEGKNVLFIVNND